MQLSILSILLAGTVLANRGAEEGSIGRNNNFVPPRLQPRGEEAIEENQQPPLQKDVFFGGFGGPNQNANNAFIQQQQFQQPGGGFQNRGPQGFQGGPPQGMGGGFWRQGPQSSPPRFQNFNVRNEEVQKDVDIKEKAGTINEPNQWGGWGGCGGFGGGCCFNPCCCGGGFGGGWW